MIKFNQLKFTNKKDGRHIWVKTKKLNKQNKKVFF